ncbi:acyl-coenzyme A:6-aminopenicillanic acid acyl-transferase-domain-containing protein [Hypoxylon rubiginosum]|uniref:Acyl-coenzyme A:6-aminopenicillanic acid acyl-transferase-domain-containing protein n=1 Tax=Hypoxylon rubiginosum TaxID=110542 RepID=A0ACC0DE12_9PEZI|nr:acyl-coenzyme A:6-aminopenicillanic acid acyl-transferase-domain-containing protein [Hypoxylon rubiginosum]
MFHGVPEITCAGSPRQIGLDHGKAVRDRVLSNIETYAIFFQECAHIDWAESRRLASKHLPAIKAHAPHLVEEMRGIAEGASVDFEDILTLNVRSEISLTHSVEADGCTTLVQIRDDKVFIAQNWDWVPESGQSTVLMDIKPHDKPCIRMLAEAGIVGKFGMNSAGLSICMNAIKCTTVEYSKLPVHIAMRKVLECSSFGEARSMLDTMGLASCVNLAVADRSGAAATIECTPAGNALIQLEDGTVCHTNHLYAPNIPPTIRDTPSKNSFHRLERMRTLSKGQSPSFDNIRKWLSDEDGAPGSIDRRKPPGSVGTARLETLATIIIDVKAIAMQVSFGRPSLGPPVKTLLLD